MRAFESVLITKWYNFIMNKVELKEGGKTLQLIFLKRLYLNENDEWDKDIIKSEINFITPSLEGKIGANIWSSELSAFKDLLKKIQSRTGDSLNEEFRFMEEAITFKISLTSIGGVEINVRVNTNHVENEYTQFAINLDQSYLPNIIESVEKVLEEFPIQVK